MAGDDSDPGTFVNKNRADTAEQDGIPYHDVTWKAIATLKYPVAKPLRKDWTAEQVAQITPFEGTALRTTGYLVAYKPEDFNADGKFRSVSIEPAKNKSLRIRARRGYYSPSPK